MTIKYSFKRSLCNCCRLNEECQAHRVTNRGGKTIPGCISPEPQLTFCEQNNVDIKVTDVAEKLSEFTDRYITGGFTPDGKIWVPPMVYDEWRRAFTNYGLINRKA